MKQNDSIAYFHNAVRIVYYQIVDLVDNCSKKQQHCFKLCSFKILVIDDQVGPFKQYKSQDYFAYQNIVTIINSLKLGKSPSSDGFPDHYY